MSDTQTSIAILFVAALVLLLGGLIFSPIVRNGAAKSWKAQVVQHGCGDFAIIDTLTGETEFQWRTP